MEIVQLLNGAVYVALGPLGYIGSFTPIIVFSISWIFPTNAPIELRDIFPSAGLAIVVEGSYTSHKYFCEKSIYLFPFQ